MRFLPRIGVFGVLGLLGFLIWQARHPASPARASRPLPPGQHRTVPALVAPFASVPVTPGPIPGTDFARPDATFVAFAGWLELPGRAAATVPDPAWLGDGIRLARERREALRELIARDPAAALARAREIPWNVRQSLPREIVALLEEWVSGTGRYEVLCAWNPPRPGARRPEGYRTFTLRNRTFQAHVHGRRLVQMTTERATLFGIAVDDELAVAEETVRPVEPAETAALVASGQVPAQANCLLTGVAAEAANGGLPVLVQHGTDWFPLASPGLIAPLSARLAAVEPGFRPATQPPAFRQWSHGIKRLLFMRARFPDDLREPISEAEAAEVMRLANDHFVEASYNNLAVISTVGPLVILPQPKLYYAVKGPGALIADARVATRAAGLDSDAFDLDVVRFENVPGFDWGGLGSVGGKGAWLQSSALGVVVHELGHNLGLGHANFWNTVRPNPPPNPQNLPFDADSMVGIDGIIGAGDDVEYGDPFDVMGGGSGGSHFSGLHKYLLGWLPEAGLATVSTSGVYRLAVHDLGVFAEVPQTLRVRKDHERFYWLGARGRPTTNLWQANGIELHWNNWHQAIGSAELLDTTPGSGFGRDDAALVLGHTFADLASQVFITPLARGTLAANGREIPVYDVAVHLGPFPGNHAPTLELEADALAVAPGDPVTFRAAAADSDGDFLAYAWDLGDGLPAPLDPEVTHRWTVPGDYAVRCEVSDLKGGRAARHLVVRVGNRSPLRISGQVIDQGGQPLLGVRVHNGRYGTNSPYAPEFRWAYTDSDGRYTLTGLNPGDYEVGGELAGYLVHPLNFSKPLVLDAFTGVGVDLIAAAVPRVTVSRVSDGSESPTAPAVFRLARSGPTNEALRVFFRLGGTAKEGGDFTPWKPVETQTNVIPTVLDPVIQKLVYGYADIGAGLTFTHLSFPVLADAATEGDESLVVALHYPVTRTIITETATNLFDLPGWEVRSDNGQDKWFQTRQLYQLADRAEATAILRDAAPAPAAPTISIVALEREVSENTGDSASFVILRGGGAPDRPLRIPLRVSGTATPGDDYEALPDELILPGGVEALRLVVRVFDDRFVEGNESVLVQLAPDPAYALTSGSASIQIVDNDLALVGVNATDPVVDENAGSRGARVTFQRMGDRAASLEIDYLVGGTAKPGEDYVSLPGRITIPPGESSVTIRIEPLDDALLEGNETVEIQLGDSPVYNPVLPARAVVVLRDDEFPVVTVEASDDVATEGGETGTFLIRRSGSASIPLVVRYRFGGTAAHQADFVASGDRVTIPAGQRTALITVTPIDDALREDPEEIALELVEDAATYTLGTPSGAAIRLLDNGDATPAVGFFLLGSRDLESRTNPEVAIRISGNPDEGADKAVTVAWEVLGGTGTLGVDYLLANGTVSFPWADPASDTPLTNRVAFIPLVLLDDLLPESDETLLLRLRIAPTIIPAEDPAQPPTLVTNGVLDVFAVHTFTILDDDQSEWNVTATVPTTTEGSAAPARFTIRRTGRTNQARTITFFLSGLAAPGSDYVAISNRVDFLSNQLSADVLIVPIDDPSMEFRENVVLTLIQPTGSRLGANRRAEVTLDDNDGTIEFESARFHALEGAREAVLPIRRGGDVSLAASALLETTPGTADPAFVSNGSTRGDFVPTNLVVHFAPGEVRREVRIVLLDDDLPEPGKTVNLRLSRGTSLFPLGGQNTAVLTIVDDDALVSPGTNVIAGIESSGRVLVALERSGPVDQSLSVRFASANRSALAGDDYIRTSGTVEFPAGQRFAEVDVPLFDDTLIEGDESFLLRLSTLDGTPISDVPVVIVDDDCALGFASAVAEIDEDGGVVDLTIIRTGSPLNPVAVDFATASGTAVAGLDFEPLVGTVRLAGNRFETLTNGTGTVVFRTGETNRTLSIRILNDGEGERDESFSVVLSQPRGELPPVSLPFVAAGEFTNVVVTIHDNESPGRVDDAFQPGLGADATVRALALQSDGKVLVGGDFTTFDGLALPRLARLHADGFVDNSFNPGRGLDGTVLALVEEPDGRIYVGGTFTRVDGAELNFLARLEPDGTRSPGFDAAPDGVVRALAPGASGAPDHVYVGGDFTVIRGQARGGVARFSNAGVLDPSFSPVPEPGRIVQALVVLPGAGGDRVLVGGNFLEWSGTGNRFLVRLRSDGTSDPAWPARLSPDGPVHALARGLDGSVYVAGAFRQVAGVPRAGLARLLDGGSVDASFDPGPGANGPLFAVGLQGEGRVIAAGAFDQFSESPAGRFVRLLPGGLVDPAFFQGTGADDAIRAVVVQPDGAILLGGDFTTVNDRPRLRVARIHADEKFVEGFLSFTNAVFAVDETADHAVVTVRRSGAGKSSAKVGYRTFDATARDATDYVAASGELVFAPGVNQLSFLVPLRNDALAEGNETVTLVLTNATGALLGRPSTATLVIRDDETAVAFELPTVEVSENSATALLVLRRSGSLVNPALVRWYTEGDSALADVDFRSGSGTVPFMPNQATATLVIPVIDDDSIEGHERFRVVLESLDLALQIGSQGTVIVTIIDDDRLPTHYNLTVEPSPGGTVIPAGGRFPTNSLVEVRALADRGFELARWEGTVASADNPLSLRMDRNHVLTARFRPRSYLETFETGTFGALPWQSSGNAPWIVTNETASSGTFAARSGAVRDAGLSQLVLERESPAGGASFDFRTASEAGWDFLRFTLNGKLLGHWSGFNGWQTFQFNVPAGLNRLEWSFLRDRTFGDALDAVWIDNLDLPDIAAPAEPPRLSAATPGEPCTMRVTGTPGHTHVLEKSTDLRTWLPVARVVAPARTFALADPDCRASRTSFYRVRVE